MKITIIVSYETTSFPVPNSEHEYELKTVPAFNIPCEVVVDARQLGLDPLPRDREIDPVSREYALKQESVRRESIRRIASGLAEFLAPRLLEEIESRDTVNGYTREELK
jgi:hypothetical protein